MRPLGHSEDNISVPRRARASAFSAVVLVVGAVAIALTLVATTDDGTPPGQAPPTTDISAESTTDPAADPGSTIGPAPEDSFIGDKNNVSVQVANSTQVDGAAGRVTDSLKTQGYITLTPTNASGGTLLSTKIHYAAGFLLEARDLAVFINVDPVESVFKMPNDPGEEVADFGDPKILILLGSDLAN